MCRFRSELVDLWRLCACATSMGLTMCCALSIKKRSASLPFVSRVVCGISHSDPHRFHGHTAVADHIATRIASMDIPQYAFSFRHTAVCFQLQNTQRTVSLSRTYKFVCVLRIYRQRVASLALRRVAHVKAS